MSIQFCCELWEGIQRKKQKVIDEFLKDNFNIYKGVYGAGWNHNQGVLE